MDANLEATLDADILAAPIRELVERERSGTTQFPPRKVEEGRRCIDRGEIEDADETEADFDRLRRDLAERSRHRS